MTPGRLTLPVTFTAVGGVLVHYDVPLAALSAFVAYTVLAGTLPGTLLWRAVRGRAGCLAIDAAFGTVAGFVVELPVYLIARSAGEPRAVAVWPIAVLVTFAVVPGLRRHWRGSGRSLPAVVTWTVAAGLLYLVIRAAVTEFRFNPLGGAGVTSDFTFQFGLVGELRHRVPLDTPWVTGTPLQYHWYVYAHGAAASWLTGIEPETLVLRLLPVPMLAAFLLILAATAHRIAGRWWVGTLTVVLTLVGSAISPYAWSDRPMFTGTVTDNLWVSPTQTYAMVLATAAVFVLAGLLRGDRRAVPWCVYAVLTGVVAGAKATYLPMLICGLLLAALVRFRRTRTAGPELGALAITVFWFGFAHLIVYGGGSQGAVVAPLQTVKWTALGQAVFGPPGPADDRPALIGLTMTAVLAMAFGWAGVLAFARRSFRQDPVHQVLLGAGLAGVGALWMVAHPGLSQIYFGKSATPWLALLSAAGLAALIPPGRAVVWFRVSAGCGALFGGALLLGVQLTIGWELPPGPGSWDVRRAVSPYLMVLVGVLGVCAVVAILGAVARLGVRRVGAIVVIPVLAAAVTSGVFGARGLWSATRTERYVQVGAAIPEGAVAAARWLRGHSAPGDVVATNSHCRWGVAGCDSRDFWLAAYAERQILVEGWSYTEPAYASGGLWDRTVARSVFWDPALLAANDAVFYRPTAARVAELARVHEVRWLVAVDGVPSPDPQVRERLTTSAELAGLAVERFRAGAVTIYEMPGGAE